MIQTFVAAILVAISVLLLNPLHLWMPDMAHMLVLAALLAAFGAFAAFILRERAGDERETALRGLAGRIGFLTGALVLVIAIALEGLVGTPDPWLVLALSAMVVAKLAARAYGDWKL